MQTTNDNNQPNTTTFSGWLMTLIAEKGVDPEQPIAAFEDVGHINLSYHTLATFVTENTSADVQELIRSNLVKLDMHHADIFDYLNHLINVMIKELGLDAYAGFVTTKHGMAF